MEWCGDANADQLLAMCHRREEVYKKLTQLRKAALKSRPRSALSSEEVCSSVGLPLHANTSPLPFCGVLSPPLLCGIVPGHSCGVR